MKATRARSPFQQATKRSGRPSPIGAGRSDTPSLPESAQSIWLRALEQIQLGVSTNQTLTKFIACGQRADLAVLIGMNGDVVRYWVRAVVGNELLAVGDTHGPLPLSVHPIH